MAGKLVPDELRAVSRKVRKAVLTMCHRTGSGHVGSALSAVDLLVGLYFDALRVSPDDPGSPSRDRFIMSKGHACVALYAVLGERGFLSSADLDGFSVNGGRLEQHPRRDVERGIEATTGSLGHGLSIGGGMALADAMDRNGRRVFVMLSDGELDEGSVWEAAMFAAHHRLSNLTAIVDYNKIQALGRTSEVIELEPLAAKWAAFGWSPREIDGHDMADIGLALRSLPFVEDKPSVVIAHTVKGKGVSFMEDSLLWHYRPPDAEEYRRAIEELER